MKRIRILSVCILIIVYTNVIFTQNNFAQSSKTLGDVNIKFSAGMNVAVSDYITASSGSNIILGVEYRFNDKDLSNLSLGFNAGFRTLKGEKNNLGFSSNFLTNDISFGVGTSYRFINDKKLYPFLYLGASFHNFTFSESHVYSNLIDKINGVDNKSFGLETKIGINYLLKNAITLTFTTGLNFILSDNLDGIKFGIHNDYFTDFNIGISYNIFQKKDSDGDGIYDEDDNCPYIAEDIDGYEDEDGCPDFDNDKDGIPDSVDVCVNIKEDFDGFEDTDGCPDFDNDKDGILDSNDKCPNQPEDFDGFEDTDGCPDFDNDKDGIPDVDDKCPNQPENKNGYKDNDGCPDVKPIIKNYKKEETDSLNNNWYYILNVDQILDLNSKTIKKNGLTKLEKIIKAMKTNSKQHWRIEGHVDKQTNHLKAIELSKKLINIIRRYLIERDVPPANLEFAAMGDSVPIANNNTVFGRMKNRRIKIIKIK